MNLKDDIKKILSGEYKTYHRAWLFSLFLIIYFFSPVPALAFSDDFNSYSPTHSLSDGGWVILSGSWNANSGYLTKTTITADQIKHSIGSGQKYIEFKFNVSSLTTNYDVYWNSGGTRGFRVTPGASINSIGFTIVATTIGADPWLKYKVTANINTAGNQIHYVAYNVTSGNNTVIDDQTVAYTYTESDDLLIASGANTIFKIDDVLTSGVAPSASNSITWGAASYVPQDTGSFSWVVVDADWNDAILGVPYSFRAEIYKNTDITQIGGVELGSQTGTSYYTFPETGTYTIKLNKYFLLPLPTSSNYIGTDAVVVRSAGDPYLTGASYAETFTETTYHYSYGVGGIARPAITVSYADPTTGNPVSESLFIISGSGVSLLPAGSINLSFKREALYTIRLKDISTGKYYASPFTVQTTMSPTLPTQNITTSSITLDKASYYYGQTMVAAWKVDNANFTSPNQTYLDIFNVDTQAITGITYANDGYWRGDGEIGASQLSANYWILIQNSAFDVTPRYWSNGNNNIRLMLYNKVTNTRTVLAYANFTLTGTNSAGYGLDVRPNPVKVNELVMMNTTVPAGVTNASLTILNGDGSATVWNPNWNLVPGSQTLTYKFQKKGTYIIGLFVGDTWVTSGGVVKTGNQTLQIQVVINVVDAAVTGTATATPTAGGAAVPSGSQAVSKMGDNLRNFMTMPAFWGLIITILLFFAIGKTVPNAMGFGMFIVMNIEAVIGLWSPYTAYILAVTWIFAGIYFSLGRKVLTGG